MEVAFNDLEQLSIDVNNSLEEVNLFTTWVFDIQDAIGLIAAAAQASDDRANDFEERIAQQNIIIQDILEARKILFVFCFFFVALSLSAIFLF